MLRGSREHARAKTGESEEEEASGLVGVGLRGWYK